MIAATRTSTLVALIVVGMAGCGGDPQLGVLTPYGEGYSDGCDSGYSEFGLESFDYRRGGILGGGIFGSDYGSGWEKGFRDCQDFIRAADL